MSTVFEVLEKCPTTTGFSDSEDDELLTRINPELKRKLELWSDPFPSSSSPPIEDVTLKKDGSSTAEVPGGEGLEALDEIAHDEYNRWANYANTRQETNDDRSRKSWNYGTFSFCKSERVKE